MRYLFRVLCFGEPIGVMQFIQGAGNVKIDEFASNEDLQVFDKELTIENNTANLELCAILKDNADFDEIIPTTDGILYFLDPSNDMELQTFYLISEILEKLDRIIPVCLVLHSLTKYFSIPVNRFANEIWWKFDYVEVFAYGPASNKSREDPIITLAEAMMLAAVPINYDYVWMRLPVFIKKTNTLVKAGDYKRAGLNAECVARIAKKFNETNYFIYAEQSAYLFQQVKEYLKAQHVLADVDPKMADFFRKAYVQSMVRDADVFFKQKMFAGAAQKYEASANWAKMELNDEKLAIDIYEKAIETWISACEIQNSFRLLEQMDHKNKQRVLSKIAVRIAQASDFLISIQKIGLAKAQLYACIDIYQREGLFEDLKVITGKILDVLYLNLKEELKAKNAHSAKTTLDEFENIVSSFEVKKVPDVSKEVSQLTELFIDIAEFSKVDELIPKITNLEEQKRITKLKVGKEESLLKQRKDNLSNLAQEAMDRVESFYQQETRFLQEQANNTLQTATSLEEKKDLLKAAKILKDQSEWLFFAKYDLIANNVHSRLLEIYLKAGAMTPFLENISKLKEGVRKQFLVGHMPFVLDCFRMSNEKQGIEASKQAFDGLNKVYRSLELFEDARKFAEKLIVFFKAEASKVIEQENNRNAISESLDYLKQAQQISDSLLDKETIVHDPVYEKITSKYIALGDLAQAEAMLHKIIDKSIYSRLNQVILDIEAKKTEAVTSEVKEKFAAEFTQSQITRLRSDAREMAMTKREDFQKRVGLKRRMFQDGLDAIHAGKYDTAIAAYLKTCETFLARKMMSEAGLALAMAVTIDLTRDKVDSARETLAKTVQKAGVSQQILEDTFPIKTAMFVLNMYKQNESGLAKHAIALLDNLPLFREELDLLTKLTGIAFTSIEDGGRPETPVARGPSVQLAGPDVVKAEVDLQPDKTKIELANIQMELEHEIGTLRLLSRDARSSAVEIMRKRTALRRAFYKDPLEALGKKQFAQAAKAYEETASSLFKRKDLPALGLVIALHGLCLIQDDQPPPKVEDSMGALLKTLGMNENVVKETFPIRVIYFILKAKKIEDKNQIGTGWSLLENFPLFDEEKSLATRPRKF